jgi:hypothetical protein
MSTLLFALVPMNAAAQQLQSGALLTIQSNDGKIKLAVYDSQIHSGIVQSPPCDTGNGAAVVTDAYVLQGGSPSGCDNGDDYEVAQAPGWFTFSGTGYNFGVTTFYQFGGCNSSGNSGPIEPICASPDSGFLTVTNNGSSFTGTITLAGNSPQQGGSYCPINGVASDSFTGTLNPGDSRTFGLAPDASNCGGYTASQTQTLTAGSTITFPVGTDDYVMSALDNAGGEQITMLPVPVLQSGSNPGSTASNTFNPGTTFSTFSCSPYADFSEAGNPECTEFQLTCAGASDCEGFLYTVTTHYSFPAGFSGIGGPGFLKASGQQCPSSLFDKNIFTFYSSDTTHTGGGGGISCFVAAFTPGDPVIQGNFTGFVGFGPPVSDNKINVLSGSSVPLIWQSFSAPNTPITNLSFCSSPNPPQGTCTAPWINLSTLPVTCPGGKPVTSQQLTTIQSTGNSGLRNLGSGNYQFNWKTVSGSKGCVTIVGTFDSGAVVYPATFQYK